MNTIHATVAEYYGRILGSAKDLKTSACCPTESLPERLRPIVGQIHPEVQERFYGCGAPIPIGLDGCTVLDLGCGTGRDAFVLSQLVGPKGRVIGVDMTEEQLSVARRHQTFHAEAFGHERSNITFHQGFIEDLKALGIASQSVDVVVSNCVINLSPAKEQVFSELFRVLKPGGEMYISDVFAGRRVPADLSHDQELLGECLGGALYIEDFRRRMRELGCLDYRVMTKSAIKITNPALAKKLGNIPFYSMTVRAFNLPLEDLCEDYGQVAYYNGTIPEAPHQFVLDDHHTFETGRPLPVCGNTADMVSATRFGQHFRVVGSKKVHFGVFACGPAAQTPASQAGACC